MKNLVKLVLFLFTTSMAQAQYEASYLIPTEDSTLQPFALAPISGVELIELSDGSWTLNYHLPWTIAGTDLVPIQVHGTLEELRSDDGVTKADCTKETTDIPLEFTLNLNGVFLSEIVCQISYKHDLVVDLDGRTGEFIDLVMQNFNHEEAMMRLSLRDQFMGEPIGFLGLKRPSLEAVND